MKPFDIAVKHLPKLAGRATIRWNTQGQVRREGPEISLPIHEQAEFLPLQGGRQFVYRLPASQNEQAVFFGGTDEEPFLVRLIPQMTEVVEDAKTLRSGEATFYQSLKPRKVKLLENTFGVEAKRQGDIFAVPIPFGWNELRAFASLFGVGLPREEPTNDKLQVFGTRHTLEGQHLEVLVGEGESFSRRTVCVATLATGTLMAPDHAPKLLDGIHALFQVEVLYRPREAD